jgi:hypothetical protein
MADAISPMSKVTVQTFEKTALAYWIDDKLITLNQGDQMIPKDTLESLKTDPNFMARVSQGEIVLQVSEKDTLSDDINDVDDFEEVE